MNDVKVRAPYNFVPFPTGNSSVAGGRRVEKVLARYQGIEELPAHNAVDPALKTGEIHVTMRAETPVFVSDGNGRFFRGANGQLMLPGSTVRGMVRENMQILGFGLIVPGEDLEDYQVYYREMAAARGSNREPLKELYRSAMATETLQGQNQKTYSIPRNVRAGYLWREGTTYKIRPAKAPYPQPTESSDTKPPSNYIRVSRKNPALKAAGLADGEAETKKVAYTAAGGHVKSIRESDQAVPGMEQGVLLYTGKAVGKPNACYLFPAADEGAEAEEISKGDLISYQEDFEKRKNILGETKRSFWALPEDGEEPKPVFYVRHDGHTYFGMSLFLRIGYKHKFSDGLPARRLERLDGEIPLDYPHAMLGFAGAEHSYRSRVSFGDFPAEGDPKEGAAIRKILGEPKPSWFDGYLIKEEEGRRRVAHYSEDEFYLRGYKLYWLKDAEAESVPADKETVASTLRPLPEGTLFHGVIRYKNLHPDELGLLLWALRLEDGCFQSVGMGKPYGFGRMKLTIDRLVEYDVGALYAPDSLCRLPVHEQRDETARKNTVAQYIKLFDNYACERLRVKKPKKSPSVRSDGSIADFFYMRGTIRRPEDVSYMELEEYGNLKTILPEVRPLREEAEAKRDAEAQEAAGTPDGNDMAALLAKLQNKNKKL